MRYFELEKATWNTESVYEALLIYLVNWVKNSQGQTDNMGAAGWKLDESWQTATLNTAHNWYTYIKHWLLVVFHYCYSNQSRAGLCRYTQLHSSSWSAGQPWSLGQQCVQHQYQPVDHTWAG